MGRAFNNDDATCLSHEDARSMAQLYREGRGRRHQVRSHWLGYHVGGYLTDLLFYPEPPIPTSKFPKEYYCRASRESGANTLSRRRR